VIRVSYQPNLIFTVGLELCRSSAVVLAQRAGGTLMSLQNTTYTGTARHRAEDDLFHYDRSRAPKATECDTGLFSAKASARHWVVSLRPRWLLNRSQPLIRPRSES
jgi:hypothetical protein